MKNYVIVLLKITAIVIIIGVLTYPLLFDPITTTFNVTASTELVTIDTQDKLGSRLILYHAELWESDPDAGGKRFSGQLEIEEGVRITVSRISSGKASLEFDKKNGKKIGRFYDTGDKFISDAPDYLRVIIDSIDNRAMNGEATIIPVNGNISLGRPIAFETYGGNTGILRSGEVSMTGSSKFSREFDAGTVKLLLGDQIIFENPLSKAFGFIIIDENPGMQVAYRVISEQARVLKPGPRGEGSGYAVKATVLDRLLKASVFQSISLAFGVLAVVISLISFSLELHHNKSAIKSIFR